MSPSPPLPSATAALVALALAAAACRPAAAAAQTRPGAPADSATPGAAHSADSLAARLARAEAAIALLRDQLGTEAETAVKARSRVRVELSARALTNAFATDGRVNTQDVPMFVLPAPDAAAAAVGSRAAGITVRQTRVGVTGSVRDVLGADFVGDLDLDFFGGASSGPGDRRLFPEPRLRTVRAELRWARTTLLVGSETPLVSDLDPASVAAVGVPGFVAAGNLWNWLPQVRLTREVGRARVAGRAVRWTVQGAVLEPFTNSAALGEADAADAGNRSGRPFVEARLAALADGAGEAGATEIARGAEVGVSLHRGWVRAAPGRLETSRAVAADWRIPLGPAMEVRGEAYAGRLLRGLGGGAIGQSYGRAAPGEALGAALRDVAAWAQVNVQPHVTALAGVGCGLDRVRAAERPIRRSNASCAAHVLWRPVQPVLVGLEYRGLRTRYDAGARTARHVNLALGFEL